jgi:hypothetical protein
MPRRLSRDNSECLIMSNCWFVLHHENINLVHSLISATFARVCLVCERVSDWSLIDCVRKQFVNVCGFFAAGQKSTNYRRFCPKLETQISSWFEKLETWHWIGNLPLPYIFLNQSMISIFECNKITMTSVRAEWDREEKKFVENPKVTLLAIRVLD